MRALRGIPLTTWLLLSGFVSVCIVSGLIIASTSYVLRRSIEHEAMLRIDTNLKVAWQVLHDLGPGVQVVNGRLLAGATVLNGNSVLVDSIQALVGGVVTIFQDDVRVATNVRMEDGGRGIGTHLVPENVRGAVLSQVRPFRGVVDVFGRPYYSGYDPILGPDGTLVGILYVGNEASGVLAEISSSRTILLYIPVGAILLVGAMFLLLGRKLSQQINQRQHLLTIAHAQLDTALGSMANGLALWGADNRLVLFNDRLCELLAIPPTRIWAGMSYRSFLQVRHRSGDFAHEDFETAYAERLAFLARRQAEPLTDVGRHGRVMNVLSRFNGDGGWVLTYEDVTERHTADSRIAFMARHDALTGLANRVLFHEGLQAAAERGEPVAVLCLDLDQFKRINDTLGHLVGDGVLRAMAARLLHCVRQGDVVARLGGDEFAIIQVGGAWPEAAHALACRIIECASQPMEVNGHRLTVGISVGMAQANTECRDAETLLRHADLALYGAKADGRGTCRFFDAAMAVRLCARHELERDLREALARDELRVFYQPLIDVRTGLVSCFEALLRWQHPTRGLVPPAGFIPAAEEMGLIVAMGAWTLGQACSDAMTWPAHVKVAVNLSALQFQAGDLLPVVQDALAASGLEAERLELEVTETMLLHDTGSVCVTLHGLRHLGVRVALDDFGTGYSSLAYLRSFPFDKIKIDQSFTREITSHPQASAIVRAIIGLASSLGIETVAEGVETREQLAQVCAEGCSEVQGYLFSKPRPAAEVAEMLESTNGHARRFTAEAKVLAATSPA